MINLINVKCEYSKNQIGLGEKKPRFSWQIQSDQTNVLQVGYELQVSSGEQFGQLLWDSGKVISSDSIHVIYEGPELKPSTRYYYRVRVWDNHDEISGWQGEYFEMGLLSQADWQGVFISAEEEGAADCSKVSYLRSNFTVKGDIVMARVYATALGMYELHLNGQRVGEALLTPGWTNYKKRLQHQTYDITHLLQEGQNALGATLGCGWYKGDIAGWVGKRNYYGKKTALLCQMLIRYADGTEQLICSNEDWKCSDSPILYSELYHGETYDARLEQKDWAKAHFDASKWKPVSVIQQDLSIVIPQEGPSVLRQEILKPEQFIITPKGEHVIDFGQNMSGWVRFKVKGQAGEKVILKHAEVLDAEGNFYDTNMRSAKCTIQYVLKGGEEETFEPHFTFQGFRYVHVEVYPGDLLLPNFEAVVIHSDMQETGQFSCSNEQVNQLVKNINWGLKGNFVDLPTDCPQRDERLGWTGDAQVFIRTASLLRDTQMFYTKWLRDLSSEQFDNGGIPYVIPDVLTDVIEKTVEKDVNHSATGWADAAVICPWTIYLSYGDVRILEDQYDSMKRWVGYIQAQVGEDLIWNTGFHFGDWLGLDAKEGSYFGATPNDLTATAFFANSVSIMEKTAGILGNTDDETVFAELHTRIVQAFQREFYTPTGRLAVRTQTAHVLALQFKLVAQENIDRTVASLVQLIQENGGHLTTGFLGTPYLCQVLSDNGRLKEAYDLLMKNDYPSWLYPITKGATTIWEHWDGIKPDGSMWSADMNSFNHYAYGAIGEWIYKVVGGIDTSVEKPGFKKILFQPQLGGGLTNAQTQIDSLYGIIALRWEIKDEKMCIHVEVPHNTTAEIHLPQTPEGMNRLHAIGSGKHDFEYRLG
ncbi:MAG: family 78 glycoside hydrolase catalytic domain [Vallitaleaceae bacterium]|nr:family 78 glycoside hydrolase catalytic domain [Vallitaleaceae bacterium]